MRRLLFQDSSTSAIQDTCLTRVEEISSENVKEMIFGGGSLPDTVDTLFIRLPVIPYDDICRNHGVPADLENSILGIADKHHYITGSCLLTVLFLGLFSAYYYRLEQRYYAKLRAIKEEEEREAHQGTYQQIMKKLKRPEELKALNDKLKTILINKQFSNFKNASFAEHKHENGQIYIALEFKQKFSIENFIAAGWNALFIMAFFYWLGWIMTGTYFGLLGIGFADCSPLISFGSPVAGGLGLYAVLKMYHWAKHRNEECLPTFDERILADELMKKCLEESTTSSVVAPQPTRQGESNSEIQLLNGARIFFTLLINSVGAYTAAHYILWIFGDMLPILGQYTNFLGIGCFVVASIAGLWHASAKYTEISHSSLTIEDYNQFSQNEEKYTNHKININKIKNKLEIDDTFLMTCARWVGKLLENPSYHKLTNLISGIFVGRLFTLVLTSAYMPNAFNLSQVVAALSNPMIACILLGTGLAWMAIRAISDHLEKRATMQESVKSAAEELRLVKIYEQGFFSKNGQTASDGMPSAISMQSLASPK